MNDMILNMLANSSFTVSDFKAVGLTAENTKLESEDKYKSSQMIQEVSLFKDENGNFSDEKFHEYYLYATQFYNNLADETYIDDLTKHTFYSKDNLFAPEGSKVIDETPKFVVSPNPFLQTNSLVRIGKKGDRTLSISEIAQSQKIYDTEKGEFRDESVNERALGQNAFKWLSDLFSEPLVIAQWDEDGTHIDPITGKTKEHKKGDYKYNDEGTFYYETLNGRDVYGRQVLNRMNTLTVDGSKINKYDFFDSDDLEQKSAIGSTMKNLALVGTMFIPYVGVPIKAASIAMQSVGLIGALGKMFLGSDNKTANNLHAWAKTVNRQTATEYASQNTWCWENLINMVGDTVGQLAEQRFLFTHVPALFKGTKGIKARDTKTYEKLVEEAAEEIQKSTGKQLNKAKELITKNMNSSNYLKKLEELQELGVQHATVSKLKATAQLEKYMKSYNNLGSIMSKAYMTGITVQDTYGEAKANGASDFEAFMLTLGYAAGELAILNSGVGEWIMPELHGDKLKYRAIVNALKKEVKPLTEAAEVTTQEGKQNFLKKIFDIGRKAATDDYAKQQFISDTYNPMKVVLAHAAGESFEELSEEVLADFSKTAFNIIGWLRGDETRISGAWKDMGDRYGMSLLGGFIGGGISSAGTDFSYARQLGKMTNESAMQEIIYMVNNDKIDDFLKFANKAELGNKYLSFEQDEKGNYKAGTKENNQDTEIKKMLNMQVLIVKDVINAEGAKFSESSLFDAVTLKDLRYLQLRNTATAGALFQEWNSLISQIVKKHEEIRKLTGEDTNTDTKKKELTDIEKGEVAKKKQELNDLRVRKDAIVSGKRAPEFIQTALYEAQEALHAHKRGYTFEGWVKALTGKNIDDLTSSEIKDLKPKYKAYRETEMKNDILGDARQFVDMVGMASKAIQDQQEYIKSILEEGKQDAYRVLTYLGNTLNALDQLYNDGDIDFDKFIQKVQTDLTNTRYNVIEGYAAPLFDDETIARLLYIDSTPDQINYGKKEKKRDKLYTIFEAFGNYSDTITQKFIEQGYIHPEVKNHLIQIYRQVIDSLRNGLKVEDKLSGNGEFGYLSYLSAFFGDEDTAVDTFDIRLLVLQEHIDNLEEKIKQIEELHSTPIIELLENFKVATSESNLSVKDVIQNINNLVNEGFVDVSTIGYGEEFGRQLDEVDELVDVLASALYATRVDESGVRNAWGYSKTLNELNKKYGNDQWIELAEIEGRTADLLQQDLALIKQKIKFAKNLNAINSGQKLNKQNKVGYNKQFIFYNKLHKLFNILPSKLTDWKGIERVKDLLKDNLLLSQYNGVKQKDRRFGLTPEEKIQIEKESLMIDDAIYEFFQENSDKLENIDELIKLVNPELFLMYDPANSLLTDESDDLDDIQFIFNLAAKAAVKSSIFYNALRKTFNDQKAPVPIQEQATYLNVAMIMNGDVMNNFAKAYSKSLFEHFSNLSESERHDVLEKLGIMSEESILTYSKYPNMFKNDSMVDKFANIILTEGIAGSGKTGGVFDSTVKIIELINPDLLKNVFIVNSTLENANKLKSDLGLEGKTFSSSHSETDHDLIRYFYSDYTSDYKDKVILDGDNIKLNFTLKEDLVDLPKVIFIDEASRYDYVQMKLLSEAAQHYGIAILAAGDFDQVSAESKLEIDGHELIMSPNRHNFIFSPKLGLSFRTLNSQMSKNQKEIIANLHDDDKRKFNVFYWENEEEIRGFKVHENTNLSGIEASIEKIKKLLNSGEKIGLLYASEDKSIYKKLEEKYGDLLDIKSINDAQGLEGNYYIIDLNQDNTKTPSQIRKELYTAITRAKHGGIIINNDRNVVEINNVKEEMSELESITPEAIKRATSKRKEIFDSIFERTAEEEMPYIPLAKIKREAPKIVKKGDDDDEETGTLPPSILPPPPPSIPTGMYRTREEAEKVDVSSFKPGLEVYDASGTLIGVIKGTSIETKDDGGITYYAPAIIITYLDTSEVAHYVEDMLKYTLKDPTGSTPTPIAKYKIGDIFYDTDGNSITITEVILGDPIKYKIDDKGVVKTILEADLSSYSTIPPVIDNSDPGTDLGENLGSDEYKRQIENTNGTDLGSNIENNQEKNIRHRMYTFNGYETGVLWDGDKLHSDYNDPKSRIRQRAHRRIDNVNGLLKLGVVNSRSTKQDCLLVLADIHDVLMNETDDGKVLDKINALLKRTDPDNQAVTIQYGIKSSARSNSDVYGTSDTDTDWHVYDKHADEKSEYSQSNVIDGDAISRKTIVAVFRDKNNKKIFEVTLGVVNSPLTIGSMTDTNGDYIYEEVGQLLATLNSSSSNTDVFNVCSQAIEICESKKYTDLKHLFKAFLFTSNGFAPLHEKGTTFNLASQRNFGPSVTKRKGDYQKNGTRQYDVKYINLEDFAKDERIVVSDIYIPKDNAWAGKLFPVHKGYPGVFVSYNKSYSKDLLPNIYMMQQLNPNGKHDVEFYYIIPPEASVTEYLINYRNLYLNNKEGNNSRVVYPIGNLWTSYNILKNIYKGGDLTETTFKSKLLDYIEFDDLVKWIEDMIEIEEKNWESDSIYQALVLKYKNSGFSDNLSNKYALRELILSKQQEILNKPFSKTNTDSVYRIFTLYIANAAYWDADPTSKPDKNILDIITKHNSGNIKYKIKYDGKGVVKGLFVPAKVNRVNSYTIDGLDNNGNTVQKHFQINSKIDPPVFEISALTTAIEILAQWEYEDPNNTNSKKKMGEDLRKGTMGYKNDSPPIKPKNNFELLKNSNKILFKKGGLFENIVVQGVDDPTKTQLNFTTEILTEFNKIPNNIGFAIVDPKTGKIKLYAYQIDKLSGSITADETISQDGLKGIIINLPLIFNSDADEFVFTTAIRNYKIRIDGKNIIFEHTPISKPSVITKIEHTNTNNLSEESFDKAMAVIKTLPRPVLIGCRRMSYPDILTKDSANKKAYARVLETYATNPDIKDLYDFLTTDSTGTLNLNVGDVISLDDTFTNPLTVKEITGPIVIAEDSSSTPITIDTISKDLFKKEEDKSIHCPTTISIKYGK